MKYTEEIGMSSSDMKTIQERLAQLQQALIEANQQVAVARTRVAHVEGAIAVLRELVEKKEEDADEETDGDIEVAPQE